MGEGCELLGGSSQTSSPLGSISELPLPRCLNALFFQLPLGEALSASRLVQPAANICLQQRDYW
jgi:hypothetical protein